MELLAIIHHPNAPVRAPVRVPVRPPVRAADDIAGDLAAVYDRAMGATSERRTLSLPCATVVLLRWADRTETFPAWHELSKGDTLVTVGQPLLECPPDSGDAAMVTPARLASLIGSRDKGVGPGLAWCGGYFAAALVQQPNDDNDDGDEAEGRGRIRLVTNFLGLSPLYRAHGRDGVTVWSNKAAAAAMLAGVELRIDGDAARQFILLSHCLGDRTLWRGVTAEPAGTCIELRGRQRRTSQYVNLAHDLFAHRQSVETIASDTVAQMRPLIDWLKGQPTRLHLSGGLDSRAVAALCRRFDYRPPCITLHTPNDEVPSARKLTRRLGMPYQTFDGGTPDLDTFTHDAAGAVWQTDGMMSLKYLAGRYDAAFIRDEDYLPLEGYGGELGRSYYIPNDRAWEKVEHDGVDAVLMKVVGVDDAMLGEAAGAFRSSVHEPARSLLEAAQGDGLSVPQAAALFYANQRARRWAAARRTVGWRLVADPLTMPCWVFRGMSAAPRDQLNDRLIKALIERAWPDASKAPLALELLAAARRRRVAGNRITRTAMAIADRFKRPPAEHVWTRTLRAYRGEFRAAVHRAADVLGPVLPMRLVDQWFDDPALPYRTAELIWHTLTVALWAAHAAEAHKSVPPCALQDADARALRVAPA